MGKTVLAAVVAAVSLALILSVGARAERMGHGMQQGMMGPPTTPPATEQQITPQRYGWAGSMGRGGMMGMGPGMMGSGGMMGMGPGMMGMGSGMMGMGAGYGGHGNLLSLQQALDLTDEQVSTIYAAFIEAWKEAIKKGAEIRIATIELRELVRAPKTDMAVVKEKLNEIAKLRTDLALARIEKHEKVKSILTPEQLKKFLRTYRWFTGGTGPTAGEKED